MLVEIDRGCNWTYFVFHTFIGLYNSPKRHFITPLIAFLVAPMREHASTKPPSNL
jgi:hypothetical protein